MGREVPTKSTPISTIEAAKVLLRLAPSTFVGLTSDGARLLLAHLWFETGNGKLMFNFNPGNISVSDKTPGDFRRPGWYDDPTNKYHALMKQGKAPSAFIAYPTLTAGVKAYLTFISKRGALKKAVLGGDPGDFANAVRTTKYTVDAPASLGNSLSKMMAGYKSKGLFESLPKGRASAGSMTAAFAILAAAGFIFWKTVGGKRV